MSLPTGAVLDLSAAGAHGLEGISEFPDGDLPIRDEPISLLSRVTAAYDAVASATPVAPGQGGAAGAAAAAAVGVMPPRTPEPTPVMRAVTQAWMRAAGTSANEPRYSVDGSDLVAYPVVPLGDKLSGSRVENESLLRIAYRKIGWEVATPTGPSGDRIASAAALDVYLKLLSLYAQAGYPESGEIRFSRYDLLQSMGWLSSGAGGAKLLKPSGRHYAQFAAALDYLQSTRFRNTSPGEQISVWDGTPMRGVQGVGMVDYYRLVEDQPGPRPTEEPLPQRSLVVLTRSFMKLLAHGARTVPVDIDLYFALPSGAPRHLCRLFAWMWQTGVTTLPLSEVFERIGSTQAECVPARARQILSKAHMEMCARGVLVAEPEYAKDLEGKHTITYRFADPTTILSEEEALIERASGFGVARGVARDLAVAARAPFERTLAATVQGKLRPRKTIASMIVHFTRKGNAGIDDAIASTAASPAGQLQMVLTTPLALESQYIGWCATQRAQRLQRRRDIDVAGLRSQIDAARRAVGIEHPSWVLDGLVALHLDRILGIESLETFLFAGAAGALPGVQPAQAAV